MMRSSASSAAVPVTKALALSAPRRQAGERPRRRAGWCRRRCEKSATMSAAAPIERIGEDEAVLAGAADQQVEPAAAVEPVVAAEAEQRVGDVAAAAVQGVDPVIAPDLVAELVAGEVERGGAADPAGGHQLDRDARRPAHNRRWRRRRPGPRRHPRRSRRRHRRRNRCRRRARHRGCRWRPAPPKNTSLPSPPTRVSAPPKPNNVSSPSLPEMMFAAPLPQICWSSSLPARSIAAVPSIQPVVISSTWAPAVSVVGRAAATHVIAFARQLDDRVARIVDEIVSLPVPPASMSAPPPPLITSSPPPPLISSGLGVPFSVSGPDVPVIVSASGLAPISRSGSGVPLIEAASGLRPLRRYADLMDTFIPLAMPASCRPCAWDRSYSFGYRISH